LPALSQVVASPEPAPPTVALGLDRIGKRDWFGAMNLFKELVAKRPEYAPAHAWLALCRAHLDSEAKLVNVPMAAGAAAAAPPAASAHPAAHLADAMAASKQPVGAVRGGSARAPGLSEQAKQRARAAGHALSCVLHPATPTELPRGLAPDVLSLLHDGLASLGDYSAVAAASGARGGGASSAPPVEWVERAAKTPSFKELLDMTGLQDVKQALFNLAAQVGAIDS
jgi:hypothetical protein